MTNHLLNLQKVNPLQTSSAPPRPGSRKLIWFGLVLLALAFVAGWLMLRPQPWRAVFLSNDQVYFGKFRYIPFTGTVSLRDVYYLQVSQPIQPASDGIADKEIKVVKLGGELHGPENKMVIPKSQIVFYEDLRADSPVVRTIEEAERRPQ